MQCKLILRPAEARWSMRLLVTVGSEGFARAKVRQSGWSGRDFEFMILPQTLQLHLAANSLLQKISNGASHFLFNDLMLS